MTRWLAWRTSHCQPMRPRVVCRKCLGFPRMASRQTLCSHRLRHLQVPVDQWSLSTRRQCLSEEALALGLVSQQVIHTAIIVWWLLYQPWCSVLCPWGSIRHSLCTLSFRDTCWAEHLRKGQNGVLHWVPLAARDGLEQAVSHIIHVPSRPIAATVQSVCSTQVTISPA